MGAASSIAQSFKIGVIAGLTGPGATYGLGIRQGAEMAVEEINQAGGINGRKLELVMVDDTTNPTRSIMAMQRLIHEQIDVVVGGWGSSQVLAHMRIPELRHVPYIVVGATHPAVTGSNNRWVFRVIQTDSIQAEELARFAVERFESRRFLVINDANEYGAANRDIFVGALLRHGVKPVGIQSYDSHTQDFGSLARAFAGSNATAIALFGTIPSVPRLMMQLRAAGIEARFLGTGGLANESLLTMAARSSEGTILTTYFYEQSDPESEEWSERFRKRFAGGAEPPRPVLAAWQYRAIRFIAAPCLARRAPGASSETLRDCIKSWRGRMFGVSGDAYFDDHGQLIQNPLFVEVRGGRFELINGRAQ